MYLLAQNENDEALVHFKRAVELGENDANAWTNLGEGYYRVGESAHAEKAWRTAISLAENILNNVNAVNELMLRVAAEAYAKTGQFDESKIYIQRFIDLGLQDPRSLYRISLFYEYVGDRTKSLAYLERALAGGFGVKNIEPSPWVQDQFNDPAFKALVETYREID